MYAIILYRIEHGCLMIDRVVGGFATDEACHSWAADLPADRMFAIVEVEFVEFPT